MNDEERQTLRSSTRRRWNVYYNIDRFSPRNAHGTNAVDAKYHDQPIEIRPGNRVDLVASAIVILFWI